MNDRRAIIRFAAFNIHTVLNLNTGELSPDETKASVAAFMLFMAIAKGEDDQGGLSFEYDFSSRDNLGQE